VRLPVVNNVQAALKTDALQIIRISHYHQYDTYFSFKDSSQGWLRYREDEFVDEKGQITNVRSRLTLIGPARERSFPHEVILSRSRYLAPATHSLRFYREYFQPAHEVEIYKDRLRFLVNFRGTDFYINIDQVLKPELGQFLEIKSTTWSRQDADTKARLVTDLISLLGMSNQEVMSKDYIGVISPEA
jgi:5-methylthioadenosine/S-adenosylhomocysteine deaminase